MRKMVIISKHVVLVSEENHLSRPSPAIIRIEDERITSIQSFNPELPLEEQLQVDSDWSVLDFSDYYISPGIIDMSVRREFEDYSQLSKAGISGGVTLIIEEDSYYIRLPREGELFSDVAHLATIDMQSLGDLETIKQTGCIGLKTYLYPPSSSVKCLFSNLELLFEEVSSVNLPLIIDPNLPNPRMHYMVSPLRLEPLETRYDVSEVKHNPAMFAAAFPEEMQYSDDEEETKSKTLKIKKRETAAFVLKQRDQTPEVKSPEKSSSADKLNTKLEHQQKVNSEGDDSAVHRRPDLFEELDYRIARESRSLVNISRAEEVAYKGSGPTIYKQKKRKTLPATQSTKTALSIVPIKVNPPKRKFRPTPIKTEPVETILKESDYFFHLGNYTDVWETKGINKILAATPTVPIHFCYVSSANALNIIRKAQKEFPNMTSEIGAVHLFYSARDIEEKQTLFKNNCVIRNESNVNLIWDLLKMNGIDLISSQHASIEKGYKSPSSGNFATSLNGINCLGFSLQAAWSVINRPGISQSLQEHYLVRLSKWMSLKPAEILGINQHRGSISEGKLADLIVWDPHANHEVDAVFSNPTMCPFLGKTLLGKIHCVFLRGQLAYDRGEFFPFGRHV